MARDHVISHAECVPSTHHSRHRSAGYGRAVRRARSQNLLACALQGLLEQVTTATVNLVNADLLAKNRGLTIIETTVPAPGKCAPLCAPSPHLSPGPGSNHLSARDWPCPTERPASPSSASVQGYLWTHRTYCIVQPCEARASGFRFFCRSPQARAATIHAHLRPFLK